MSDINERYIEEGEFRVLLDNGRVADRLVRTCRDCGSLVLDYMRHERWHQGQPELRVNEEGST